MGKKGHNWRARVVTNDKVKIDRSEEKKIKLDLPDIKSDGYDDSNALVLPSVKRKTKVSVTNEPRIKPLTKKQKRNLEKIVERKQKRSERSELLKQLELVQASSKELSHMISTADMQSGKTQKKFHLETLDDEEKNQRSKLSTEIFGDASHKKYRKLEMEAEVESSESDIDTSDMSTDEEDEDDGGSDGEEEKEDETKDSMKTAQDGDDVSLECKDARADAEDADSKKMDGSMNIPPSKHKTIHIPIYRDPQIEVDRQKLPVCKEEQMIVEKINENDIVIVCGETGSGKTTQIPQFLYEAGYAHSGGIIGITEPRRVAAVCMAERVAHEMNLTSREVSYQIRYEGTTSNDTKIKFMTDGVLLKEVQKDFELTRYSVILLDEAHERSIYTDILIGFLSRIVRLRRKRNNPLKLIIMSATLRVADFTDNKKLFPVAPPVVNIDARQFPVSIHFNRRTPRDDYVEEAFKKVCKIHRRLPDGGVLVFVTSQQEVHLLCNKLRRTFPKITTSATTTPLTSQATATTLTTMPSVTTTTTLTSTTTAATISTTPTTTMTTATPITTKSIDLNQDEGSKSSDAIEKSQKIFSKETTITNSISSLPVVNLDDFSAYPKDEDDDDDDDDKKSDEDDDYVYDDDDDDDDLIAGDESSDDDDEEEEVQVPLSLSLPPPSSSSSSLADGPMYVLPLYSLLSSDKQALVFKPPPPGYRLCIVATNVAETSLTIPNIKYVVDTGKVKTKFYDTVTGVSTFKVTFISQASANQRSGRAGRTGPGHCYRLYSSAVFSDFELFSEPEITRRPVEDLVLQLKDIGVDRVKNFPFPTPPSVDAIEAAEKLLFRLGALKILPTPLSISKPRERIYTLTDLGRTLSRFPLSPRYSKMLSLGHQHHLMPYVVALVAALSVQEVFLSHPQQQLQDHHQEHRDGVGGGVGGGGGGGDEEEEGEEEDAKKELMKQRRNEMQQLRLKWIGKGETLLLGDAMLLLKVVCLCSGSGGGSHGGSGGGGGGREGWSELCEKYGVRWKALMEISKLRKQLTNILNASIPDLNISLDPSLSPPSQVQAKLLRQIILSGLVDHVARRLPDVSGLSVEEARKRKNAYEDMSLVEPVFIHPSSTLFKSKCEYVVYQYIEESTKLYMKGVTAVEVDWLPLFAPTETRFDPPKLDDPNDPPTYDDVTGRVICRMTGKFGPQFWPLPQVSGEPPKSLENFRWFSRFFLEGVVCPKLVPFKSFLVTPPSTMVKSWAHLLPRTTNLLQALMDRDVHCKDALLAEWKKDPKFLLKEYNGWLPDEQHATVAAVWPPTI